MPLAVTHILFPIILLSIIRKRKFLKISNHQLLVAGIVGILPDIDVVLEILYFLASGSLLGVHRAVTHSLLIPLFILPTALVWKGKRPILLISAFAWTSHVALDILIAGNVSILFPITRMEWGLSLLTTSSSQAMLFLLSGLDAVVFLAWLWHEEKYKKIKDFL